MLCGFCGTLIHLWNKLETPINGTFFHRQIITGDSVRCERIHAPKLLEEGERKASEKSHKAPHGS